jgi:hypothetical protein
VTVVLSSAYDVGAGIAASSGHMEQLIPALQKIEIKLYEREYLAPGTRGQ